jgi:hypothetical protein
VEVLDDAGHERIDEILETWRQGDCVLGEHWFLFRTDLAQPLTKDGAVAAAEKTDDATSEVVGFMVVTQTCGIIRSCQRRPFLEVCPLVVVKDDVLREVERGRRPNYAFIAGLAAQQLVADLDRVMTVEKSVLRNWQRVRGCNTDDDARRMSQALARKRARVAFPDAFVRLASSLMSRMSSKHDKESDEGRALRALREIRVRASPSWKADKVELMFWFIRSEDQPSFENQRWDHYLEAWLKRMPSSGRFAQAEGVVQTLDDLTAREYIESDPLDLDHLSTRELNNS